MTSTKFSDTSSFHQPLLSDPQSLQSPPQYVVVLPPYPHRRRCLNHRLLCSAAVLLSLIAAAFLLWPSDPELSVVRLSLDRLHFHARPKISLDVALNLTVRVRNKDFYSIDYDSLLVTISYRGERLGSMTSDGGRIKARGSSYVNAVLQVDGVEILSDVILLLEDLVRGEIVFATASEISGKLGLFFFAMPLKAKISCEVIVNTRNQTITRQSCYPGV